MKKFIAEYQYILMAVVVVLVNIGANLTMVQNLKSDLSDLKSDYNAHKVTYLDQELKVKELELRTAAIDTRLTSNEAAQRSDHEVLLKMTVNVERIVQWVDRQDAAHGKP